MRQRVVVVVKLNDFRPSGPLEMYFSVSTRVRVYTIFESGARVHRDFFTRRLFADTVNELHTVGSNTSSRVNVSK